MASRRRRSRDGPDERPKAERREQQGGRGSPGNPGGAPAHDARDRSGEQGGPSAQARVHRWSESNAPNVPTASRRTTVGGQKKSPQSAGSSISAAKKNPGGVLLSHTASRAVPSAPRSLTSEFGMGSGVASSRTPPETCGSLSKRASRNDTVRTAPGKRDSRNPNPACESQMCLRDMTKPHGLLVPVSSANCVASTPGLSTSWSTRGL